MEGMDYFDMYYISGHSAHIGKDKRLRNFPIMLKYSNCFHQIVIRYGSRSRVALNKKIAWYVVKSVIYIYGIIDKVPMKPNIT